MSPLSRVLSVSVLCTAVLVAVTTARTSASSTPAVPTVQVVDASNVESIEKTLVIRMVKAN